MYRNIIFGFILLGCCVIACRKNDHTGVNRAISLSPISGPAGNIVTITGSGFNTDASHDVVTFNGVSAQILHVSATQLVVVVPDKATTGPVIVTVDGRATEGVVYTLSSI